MEIHDLPVDGAASPELRAKAHAQWMECARGGGIDLAGFDPNASLAARIAWAMGIGLIIATIYTRFSTKAARIDRRPGAQARSNSPLATGCTVPPN